VYLARNKSKKREEIKIYAIDFPPKDLVKKVSILVDIKKSLAAHESELHLKKGNNSPESWLETMRVSFGNIRESFMSKTGQRLSKLLYSSFLHRFIRPYSPTSLRYL